MLVHEISTGLIAADACPVLARTPPNVAVAATSVVQTKRFICVPPSGQKVPVRFLEMLFVVSVTVTFVNTTVMGGEQLGWKVAVTLRLNSALPF